MATDDAESLVLQAPTGTPQQLILLMHGLGASPADLVPLGAFLAEHFPQAFIVSLAGREPCDFASGRQWFSVRDIDEENRPARIAAALPDVVAAVRRWQAETGLGAEPTALIGFSQGAIMALESTQRPAPATALAGRVVGIAGRFGTLPREPALDTTFHLLHGKADAVIPYGHAVAAAERLVAIGADVTADVLPFVGHGIDDELAALLVRRLTTHVPRRTWEAAMRAGAKLERGAGA